MHSKISATVEHGLLDFFDEQSLAANFGQGNIEDLVALRLDDLEPNGETQASSDKSIANVFRLPQREPAAPRSDCELVSH